VKTRTSGRFGIGSEAITPEKYRRLHHLARRWCRARGIIGDYRIDVISIDDLVLPTMRHLRRVIL
jgi:putative endonuclease